MPPKNRFVAPKSILNTSGREQQPHVVIPNIQNSYVGVKTNLEKWHYRFGHSSKKAVRNAQNTEGLFGVEGLENKSFECITCATSKITRESFPAIPAEFRKFSQPLELVHMDVCSLK